MPFIWALFSVSCGQLMLLSFWVGMGTSKTIWRLLGALLGCPYVAAAPFLYLILSPDFAAERMSDQLIGVSLFCAFVVLLLAGGFLLMRRWFCELRRIPDPAASARSRFQYSILHLLLFTSIVAVVVGLTRSARTAEALHTTGWQAMAGNLLLLVGLLVNSLCAARAPLGTERIGLPVFLVCVVAILFGVAVGVALRWDRSVWWVFPCTVLAVSLPTVIVVVSLLVVRSCGYRIIPKQMALAEDASRCPRDVGECL